MALLIVVATALVVVRVQRHLVQAKRDAETRAEATIAHEVAARTAELEATVNRYRIFVENTDAIAFEVDLNSGHLNYVAPQVTRLLASTSKRTRREFLGKLIHPDDRARVNDAIAAYVAGPPSQRPVIQYRLVRDDGRIVHVRTLLSDHNSDGLVRGVAFDVTPQVKLETEMRHAQKLESVGRLAAGVAHEINTPVQYVQDSVQFVREAIVDLFLVIDRHRAMSRHIVEDAAVAEDAQRALDADDVADLDYLFENLPLALDRATEGLGRVTSIVHSLKAFAHSDQKRRSVVDLNEALHNTLEIARNEYKYRADVELDLHHDIPRVECFAGEINQVLLNLIINAAHAIEDAHTDERGTIRVRSRYEADCVEISIGDTGCGIPDEMRDRIFEPFFTTKKLGRGTGQGLSMARSVIVDKHGGTLTFESTVGVGTTFTIRLPVNSRQLGAAA